MNVSRELLPDSDDSAKQAFGSSHFVAHPTMTSRTSISPSAELPASTKHPPTSTVQPKKEVLPLILFYHQISPSPIWWFSGQEKDFAHCPFKCRLTGDKALFADADLVLFQTPRSIKKEGSKIKLKYFVAEGIWPTERGNSNQVRMFFARERQTATLSGKELSFARYMFNYTLTWQQDADIFYPYGYTVKLPSATKISNYAAGKTRLIFWMVSNCGSRKRMDYKKELEKYVQVDMIGACNKTHGDPCDHQYSCLITLKRKYKFYLAFENSMCQEYITEKFWKALKEGMVPIVMGAPRKTYESVGPPNSFIHVDDFLSPQHLSQYLLKLAMFKRSLFTAAILSSFILLISLAYLWKSPITLDNCGGQSCWLSGVKARSPDILSAEAAGVYHGFKTSLEYGTQPPFFETSEPFNDPVPLNDTESEEKTPLSQVIASKASLSNSSNNGTLPLSPPTKTKVSLGAQPKEIVTATSKPANTTKPLILFYNRINDGPIWWFTGTDKDFANCAHKCKVTGDISLFSKADLVLFQTPRFMSRIGDQIKLTYFRTDGIWPTTIGNPNQVRMFYAREPETAVLSGESLSFARYMFNYTITFQQSADIFYPYGHTVKRPSSGKISDLIKQKKRLVFWMVSNCYSRRRMNYKEELEKYIQVDMIGACNKTHGDPCKRDYRCIIALKKQYKFYLAFENSMCQEYITEKFWKALNEEMVPIVMGAPRKTYERVGPPNSFIHVDDFLSPQHLAQYLLKLDKDDSLYSKYHKWRETHSVQWNSANCDICRFATEKPPKITDITQAWDAKTQCVWP
ncbi:uncharacterized protein [Watersipora subatra]|uniref:uncharacterized protein n=1 Tax=Watersipora subatra TaxID=2589382 RepID=UPI00355C0AD3